VLAEAAVLAPLPKVTSLEVLLEVREDRIRHQPLAVVLEELQVRMTRGNRIYREFSTVDICGHGRIPSQELTVQYLPELFARQERVLVVVEGALEPVELEPQHGLVVHRIFTVQLTPCREEWFCMQLFDLDTG
jgi:hypothetical protein